MNQELFQNLGNELKEARENKKLTIEQAFAKTRIDKKFLSAMEEGNFSLLPEVYIKAFVKEYAKSLELDEKEIVRKYDSAKKGTIYNSEKINSDNLKAVDRKIEIEKKIEESNKFDDDKSLPEEKSDSKKNLLYIIIGILLLISIFVIYNLFLTEENKEIVTEKPFEEVLEEVSDKKNETEIDKDLSDKKNKTKTKKNKKLLKKSKIESAKISPKKVEFVKGFSIKDKKIKKVSTADTKTKKLVLKIIGSEKSWVRVVADDKDNTEFILDDGITREVTASQKFYLHIGNSGGLKLFLNNKELNFVGTTGKVRKLYVTKNGIEYLKKTSTSNVEQE